MRYHSWQVISKGEATDFNGDVAQTFLVILGGDKAESIKLQLEDILEKNL